MCVVTRKFSQYNLFFLKKEIDKVHSFSTFNSTKLGKCEDDKDGVFHFLFLFFRAFHSPS